MEDSSKETLKKEDKMKFYLLSPRRIASSIQGLPPANAGRSKVTKDRRREASRDIMKS